MLAIRLLPLTPLGYCKRCAVIKLSVADYDGTCMYCAADVAVLATAQLGRPVHGRTVCVRCGSAPVVYRSKCRPCNQEDTRQYRAQRKTPMRSTPARARRREAADGALSAGA